MLSISFNWTVLPARHCSGKLSDVYVNNADVIQSSRAGIYGGCGASKSQSHKKLSYITGVLTP